MDFGTVTLDGFVVGSEGNNSNLSSMASDPETRHKGLCGSGYLKQARSGVPMEDWTGLKMAKMDDLGYSKAMLMGPRSPSIIGSGSLFPESQQQQMLSFSNTSKPEPFGVTSDGFLERSLQSASLPYYHLSSSPSSLSSSSYGRNTGLEYNGGLNVSMNRVLTGVRGPFTPSQWMELEHQALIFKYIHANAPIPPNLLISIKKSLTPSGYSPYSPFSAGSLRPTSLGWGSFHLGFSGSNDPEPGRCRRTDGKKWRCSRDAVADQKYCERHMNRGRHRSRKPVEGQTGHAAPGTTAPTQKTMIPIPSSSSAPAVTGGCSSNSQQNKSFQSDPTMTNINRMLTNKDNLDVTMGDNQSLSMLTPMNLKSRDSLYPNLKQTTPFGETSCSDFGLVSSGSLLNKSSTYLESSRSYVSTPDLNNNNNDQDPAPQTYPLRHFIDAWSNNRSEQTSIAWPGMTDIQSDRTQLSISIPMPSSEFSSSSSSPPQDRVTLSPLRLSREFNPIEMGLGIGGNNAMSEVNQKQSHWIPISWESSMGGPLGEVLNSTNNALKDYKNSSSALNLMTEGWDASPRMVSSPTGVLQKTAFGSLSSSTGSSPRAENRTHEGTSLCEDLLGSTLMNSSSIPSL
ncbi:Growth-regulating factor 6 [Acorus calamus]|uniref:Growth-regulating factor n=1 Tax=Acorus calamus TaxID=4465 RepID=A0AAV9CVN2_ACOCL|nr:Growth-regulating factor 6 [Acorus calamus]